MPTAPAAPRSRRRWTSCTVAATSSTRRSLRARTSRRSTMLATLSAFRRGGGRSRPHVAATRVRVRGGYEPDTIYGRVGEPVRIVFRREETAACSERVVFPAFGKSAMLPPYQDVVVELLLHE